MEVHGGDDGLCMVSHAGVFIHAWSTPMTLARLDVLQGVSRTIFTVGKPRHASLCVVLDLPDFQTLDAGVRKRIGELTAQIRPHVAGHAYALLGTGLWTSVARTVVAAAQLTAVPQRPWKVTDSVETALKFLGTTVTDVSSGPGWLEDVTQAAQHAISQLKRA